MNELIARVAALFVEPRAVPAPRRVAADRRALAAASVVILGDASVARTGVAVASALARCGRAPFALLCAWPGLPATVALPPLPSAARAAAKLRARGHDARAGGRVVTLALARDEHEALAERGRAVAAAGPRDVPLVTAWCGPRPEALEHSLGDHDLALVVTRPEDTVLAEVAVARLEAQHPALRIASAVVQPPGRFGPPPRAAVRAVLEALR